MNQCNDMEMLPGSHTLKRYQHQRQPHHQVLIDIFNSQSDKSSVSIFHLSITCMLPFGYTKNKLVNLF